MCDDSLCLERGQTAGSRFKFSFLVSLFLISKLDIAQPQQTANLIETTLSELSQHLLVRPTELTDWIFGYLLGHLSGGKRTHI